MVCASVTSAATSGRRDHSVVGTLREQMCATVVPHEPAPITATLIDMAGGYGELRVVAAVVTVKAFSQATVRAPPRLYALARAVCATAMSPRGHYRISVEWGNRG